MNIIVILGIIDVIAGIILALGGFGFFQGNALVFFFAVAMIGKGIWSWICNIADAGGKGTKLDFMGVLDIIAGIMMFLAFSGFFLFFFIYFGVMVLIKGAYSFMMGCIR